MGGVELEARKHVPGRPGGLGVTSAWILLQLIDSHWRFFDRVRRNENIDKITITILLLLLEPDP